MTDNPGPARRRVLLTILLVPVYLLVGELSARAWVRSRYSPERIEELTTHSPVRGRFASHPCLPFALNPAFKGHNELGFRGASFERKKPAGTRRVVCVGASTTYGSLSDPHDSYPAQLGILMAKEPGTWEVVNGGIVGTVSTETLVDLEIRVLPVDPDVVVIMPARNEVFPQVYNRFRADYTHYRRPGFNFTVSNYVYKELFRWSRLVMLACTVGGGRFGWSERDEHPLYGGIVWENRPTPDEAIRNSADRARVATYRRNLESMIAICRVRGIQVVVCTMAFRPGDLDVEEMPKDPRLAPFLGELANLDNQIAREVAERTGAKLVEIAPLSDRPELFVDDAHMNLEGHRVEAQMIRAALVP
jgi:lysophospholipase L1-like esterase